MDGKSLVQEIARLHKIIRDGSKEIHRLVDIWTAAQLRIDALHQKLKRVEK